MIYIARDNTVYGPYSDSEAYEHFKSGQLLQTDLASTDGKSNWKPLLDVLLSAGKETTPIPSIGNPEAPRRNRTKWIVVGAVSLVIVATGIFSYPAVLRFGKAQMALIQQKRELEKNNRAWEAKHALLAPKIAVANEALSEFHRIESALQAGVNLTEYSRLVLNAKMNIDRILPRISDDEWRKSLNDTMTSYIVARDFWMRSNELSDGEPFFHMPEEDLNLFKRYGLTWGDDRYVSQKYGLRQIWNHAKGCSGNVELIILGDKIGEKHHRQK